MNFTLDEGELQRSRAFKARHEAKHGPSRAASGGRYTFRFTPTSLGVVIQISCGSCRQYKDITDYRDW